MRNYQSNIFLLINENDIFLPKASKMTHKEVTIIIITLVEYNYYYYKNL